MNTVIKIGTRGSELALWQANKVADMLREGGMASEIVTIDTTGDKYLHKNISKLGGKGVFTDEIEKELRNGSIQIAVHSAKDMQSVLTDDLELIAFTEREREHDVLVSFNKYFAFDDSQRLVLGTSSARRLAMIKHYLPKVKTTDVRGNLQTRMRKLEEGLCDALVLAYAGVVRMNLSRYIVMDLDIETFTPAVGQGTIAIEAGKNLDPELREAIRQAVNHEPTEIRLRAERSFLRKLEGGCSVPVFALAEYDSKKRLVISGGVISTNGKDVARATCTGSVSKPEALGLALAAKVTEMGALEILEEMRKA